MEQTATQQTPPKMTRPVVDTARSPHAQMRPVSPGAVTLTDAFWEPRMAVDRTRTLFSQYRQCEETGRIDNFRRAAGKRPDLPFQGIFFNDSDVYKWLEAAAVSLGTHPDAELESVVDGVIEEIAAAQQPDGYLNTYFMFEREGERWTNLKDMHELYCAGHLIQAAVAHRRATGKEALLNVAVRLADHILNTFGPEKRMGTCGHQEIEMAMVELHRETGDARYLEEAEFFIAARGQKPPVVGGGDYNQDHVPFKDATENVGHAVRQLYMNAGAADVALETGDAEMIAALDRLWDDFTTRKMHFTGGAGARYEGEAFGAGYELPNARAYTETCAAIAAVMWAHRMLLRTADARYADVLERALYNGVLSGLSLDGERYFYQNPLADRGGHRREAWFGCACCPPNVARTLAELPGYVYGVSEEGAYVHIYAQGTATLYVAGTSVTLETTTRYPWDGVVCITVTPETPAALPLYLRIPNWCEDATVSVNGESVETEVRAGTYAEVRRHWNEGDVITLDLPMPARAWEAHPHAESNTGKIALTRGPLVYCLEAADNEGLDVWNAAVSPDATWTPHFHEDLLNGVTTLTTQGEVEDTTAWNGTLYRPAANTSPPTRPAQLAAIPYYAWANRNPGPMTVWMRCGSN